MFTAGPSLRLAALMATVVGLMMAVASWLVVWPQVTTAWGADYDFFVDVANRIASPVDVSRT